MRVTTTPRKGSSLRSPKATCEAVDFGTVLIRSGGYCPPEVDVAVDELESGSGNVAGVDDGTGGVEVPLDELSDVEVESVVDVDCED
jgi:hypothetical protein